MSRNIFENKEYYLAYGIDDYLGKFVQIYSKEKGGLTEGRNLLRTKLKSCIIKIIIN